MTNTLFNSKISTSGTHKKAVETTKNSKATLFNGEDIKEFLKGKDIKDYIKEVDIGGHKGLMLDFAKITDMMDKSNSKENDEIKKEFLKVENNYAQKASKLEANIYGYKTESADGKYVDTSTKDKDTTKIKNKDDEYNKKLNTIKKLLGNMNAESLKKILEVFKAKFNIEE